jgi:pimeloyl-ACP methyl ester carboxylesterase
VDVAPVLAQADYRVIVPNLRGYGTTRFVSSDTFRNGQLSVFAVDSIALMDALQIERAILADFDWGATTANRIVVLWPERCKALVSVSGYFITNRAANKLPLPPQAEFQWWYNFYFATERGRAGYERYMHDFAKLIWRTTSPTWDARRGHLRAQRRGLRQPGSCQHRDPFLSLSAWTGRRRAAL